MELATEGLPLKRKDRKSHKPASPWGQISLEQTNCLSFKLQATSFQSFVDASFPGKRAQFSPSPSLNLELSGCSTPSLTPHLVKFQGLQSVQVQLPSSTWSVPPIQMPAGVFSCNFLNGFWKSLTFSYMCVQEVMSITGCDRGKMTPHSSAFQLSCPPKQLLLAPEVALTWDGGWAEQETRNRFISITSSIS